MTFFEIPTLLFYKLGNLESIYSLNFFAPLFAENHLIHKIKESWNFKKKKNSVVHKLPIKCECNFFSHHNLSGFHSLRNYPFKVGYYYIKINKVVQTLKKILAGWRKRKFLIWTCRLKNGCIYLYLLAMTLDTVANHFYLLFL